MKEYNVNDYPNLDSIYEIVKNNKIGWKEEFIHNGKKYLVFVRPDETIKDQTEVGFRELVKDK